jgi:hypothetical protein
VTERPRTPLPKRPYRDSVILNVVLAALIVLISWATGGELGRAFVFAGLYFVVATAWAWWRFRQRLEKERP